MMQPSYKETFQFALGMPPPSLALVTIPISYPKFDGKDNSFKTC